MNAATITATSALPDFDPERPTFEIWLDAERFASTQVPALAQKMYNQMTSGESGKRYGNRTVELRIVNDRRSSNRLENLQ